MRRTGDLGTHSASRSGSPIRLIRAACIAGLAVAIGAGANPAEVVRLHVPLESIRKLLPADTPLTGLGAAEFESLVARASKGWEALNRPSAYLVRARHSARWNQGLLEGRSQLFFDHTGARPTLVRLKPWTPVVLVKNESVPLWRSLGDGALAIPCEPGVDGPITIEWELRSREGTDGLIFPLGLPDCDSSSLVLDLPTGIVPEGSGGIRQGPAPSSDPLRATWRFEGQGGPTSLILSRSTKPQSELSAEGPSLLSPLVSGNTRIEIEGLEVRWQADWTVVSARRMPTRLIVELDPGLEPLEVLGPSVLGFEPIVSSGKPQLSIRLAANTGDLSVPISIRAAAKRPETGRWEAPAARPIHAAWTGGITTIRIDALTRIGACEPLAGRRVPAAGETAENRGLLAFEAAEPRPVAALTFLPTPIEPVASIIGVMQVDPGTPRFSARLELQSMARSGRPEAISLDVSPGWLIDQARDLRSAGELELRSEPAADGYVRYHFSPSGEIGRGRPVGLELTATAVDENLKSEQLDLPRILPVGVRLSDERWSLMAEPDSRVEPLDTAGINWIEVDPSDLPTAAPDQDPRRPLLSWRWTSKEARARVTRVRVRPPSVITSRTMVTCSRGRLRTRTFVRIDDPGSSPGPLVLGASVKSVRAPVWWRHDGSRRLRLNPIVIPKGRREALGFPPDGEAWELPLAGVAGEDLLLECEWEEQLEEGNQVPLIIPARGTLGRGTIFTRAEPQLRVRYRPHHVRMLDLQTALRDRSAGPSSEEMAAEETGGTSDNWAAFGYEDARASLGIECEVLNPAGFVGVIRTARVRSQVDPGSSAAHTLTMRVATSMPTSLVVGMPDSLRFDRLEVDGVLIAPVQIGNQLHIELDDSNPARALTSISIHYTSIRPIDQTTTAAELLPTINLPCLDFGWEVSTPAGWEATFASRTQSPVDSRGTASFPGLRGLVRKLTERGTGQELRLRLWSEVGPRLEPLTATDATLGDYLLRLDSGDIPIVVDRVAMADLGLSARSRIPAVQQNEGTTANRAERLLERGGLKLLALDSVILVTTDRILDRDLRQSGTTWFSPGHPERLEERARLAAYAGSDDSDRFQSVSRWLGEVTSRSVPSPFAVDNVSADATSRETARYDTVGWPSSELVLSLHERQVTSQRSNALGLLIFLSGVMLRRRWGLAPAVILLAAIACKILGGAFLASASTWAADGFLWGAIGASIYSLLLGYSVTRFDRGPSPSDRDPQGRWGRLVGRALGFSCAILLIEVGAAAALASREEQIIAFFTYEGPLRDRATDGRVILKLADYQHLRNLAEASDPLRTSSCSAIDAEHEITPTEGDMFQVRSEYRLLVEGEELVSWTLPIGGAIDLSAQLDGVDKAIEIGPGSKTAVFRIKGSGTHSLRLDRSFRTSWKGSSKLLSIPVTPVASARIAITSTDGNPSNPSLPTCRGAIATDGRRIKGNLGPERSIEIVWPGVGDQSETASGPSCEALLLWDVQPSGDLLRSHLTYRGAAELRELTFRIEAGSVLRSIRLPDSTRLQSIETRDSGEVAILVDPPLPPGASIDLEFWRAQANSTRDQKKESGSKQSPGSLRRVPSFEPTQVSRFQGLLAMRRPGDWTGRLTPGRDTEATSDELFVRSWGELPPEPLTLAGTVQFQKSPQSTIGVRPVQPSVNLRPSVTLNIEPGRIGWSLLADFQRESGNLFETSLTLPSGLELTNVEGPHLIGWHRSDDRLILSFEGLQPDRWSVQIEGYLAGSNDKPAFDEERVRTLVLGWPQWSGCLVMEGILSIRSPSPLSLGAREGLFNLESTSPGIYRYRVVGDPPIELSWARIRPSSKVSILSHLTLYPGSAVWLASVDYEFSHGAVDTLYLNLPTTWASEARLIDAPSHQVRSEPRGDITAWTIQFDRPVWGRVRVLFQSEQSPQVGGSMPFPDLVPLGRGSVETRLGVSNRTGHPIKFAESEGLQPIEYDRFRAQLPLGHSVSPGFGYQVMNEPWYLTIQDEGPPGLGPREQPTRVLNAEQSLIVQPGGEVFGVAQLDVRAGSGSVYEFSLPAGSTPWAAGTENGLASLYRSTSGTWLVPLPFTDTGRISLIWNTSTDSRSPEQARSIPIPRLATGDTPAFLGVYADGWDLLSATKDLSRLTLATYDVERLAALLSTLESTHSQGSPPTGTDPPSLLPAYLRVALQFRSAARSIRLDDRSNEHLGKLPGAKQELAARVSALRQRFLEGLRSPGFEGLAESVAIIAGSGEPDSTPLARDVDVSLVPFRLRRTGQGQYFEQREPRAPGNTAITLRPTTTPVSDKLRTGSPWDVTLASLGCLSLLIVAGRRRIGTCKRLAISALLSLGALMAGVSVALVVVSWVGVALTWLGRAAVPSNLMRPRTLNGS